MTREEFKQDLKDDVDAYGKPKKLMGKVNRLFDEHEAQLKAKDEEIAKYQIAIDKQSKRAKALKQLSLEKDEEIAIAKSRHKLEHERYLIFEAIVKEKDEEIERLKEALEVITAMCELGLKTQDTYSKIIQKMKSQNKTRSIVAMLFWEWRKDKRIYENANKYTKETAELYVNCSELSFKKAYAMLKDKQC